VDDEASLRGLLRRVLAGAGFSVLEAAHGEEALQQVGRLLGRLSLVITDIHMPVMDGLAFARALRERALSTPVLFITGRESRDLDVTESAGPGADLLRKPFTPAQLLEAAVRLAKEPSARQNTV
jgi:CheY-like chemotaxis protein